MEEEKDARTTTTTTTPKKGKGDSPKKLKGSHGEQIEGKNLKNETKKMDDRESQKEVVEKIKESVKNFDDFNRSTQESEKGNSQKSVENGGGGSEILGEDDFTEILNILND